MAFTYLARVGEFHEAVLEDREAVTAYEHEENIVPEGGAEAMAWRMDVVAEHIAGVMADGAGFAGPWPLVLTIYDENGRRLCVNMVRRMAHGHLVGCTLAKSGR